MDLAKTLEGLSAAATQGEWGVETDAHGQPFPSIVYPGSPFEFASFTAGENAGENQANADFVVSLVNAYRTGKLIVVDHPQATSPVDDREAPNMSDKHEIARLREALSNVTKPIEYLQRRAEAEGSRLNGVAYQIANDIAFVQSIARRALGDEA